MFVNIYCNNSLDFGKYLLHNAINALLQFKCFNPQSLISNNMYTEMF